MSIKVLKDVLIEKGRLERYFEGSVPKDLWRALNRKQGGSPFDFVEKAYKLSNGRPRPADIKIEHQNGEPWVFIKDRPRGLSTFDKKGVPTGKDWEYFKIPGGTDLPEGLAIVEDEYNERFKATHFTIAPAYDMPLAQFKNKLKLLANKLIKEAV
ncbi:hypothetical protein [Microbulbifer aggregans]|uniref:Tse2 family ADP-ribosyltransferase toxin n=1 Tax=Microbulbifer aggregans TaxID=1769779 RepID=UPI001CFD7C50|nr:hypothetical protein [Microbulbifer aggregans]